MGIQLEQEQVELLSRLVEAYRNVPRDQRHPFVIIPSDESNFARVRHSGFPSQAINAYEGDIDTLSRKGLLALSAELSGSVYTFDITPEGFACYRNMKELQGQSVQRIETHVSLYLESDQFQQKHSRAYQKWRDAEAILWESDSERQLTTVVGFDLALAVSQWACPATGAWE